MHQKYSLDKSQEELQGKQNTNIFNAQCTNKWGTNKMTAYLKSTKWQIITNTCGRTTRIRWEWEGTWAELNEGKNTEDAKIQVQKKTMKNNTQDTDWHFYSCFTLFFFLTKCCFLLVNSFSKYQQSFYQPIFVLISLDTVE